MDQFLKFLQQFNQGAGIITGMLTPTGAISMLLSTIQAIRNRQKAGELTAEQAAAEVIKATDAFDAALAELAAANQAYWQIPVKPVDPDIS